MSISFLLLPTAEITPKHLFARVTLNTYAMSLISLEHLYTNLSLKLHHQN